MWHEFFFLIILSLLLLTNAQGSARFQHTFQDVTFSWLVSESESFKAAFQDATGVSSIDSTTIDLVGATPRITFTFPPEESAISAMNDMNQLLPTWLNEYQSANGADTTIFAFYEITTVANSRDLLEKKDSLEDHFASLLGIDASEVTMTVGQSSSGRTQVSFSYPVNTQTRDAIANLDESSLEPLEKFDEDMLDLERRQLGNMDPTDAGQTQSITSLFTFDDPLTQSMIESTLAYPMISSFKVQNSNLFVAAISILRNSNLSLKTKSISNAATKRGDNFPLNEW